ncbi:smc n terminal domain-containing protein [Cystoisospora suis]|uniref:Smc n terminal domain-containing protein n=1 Tax=Cystoisospora suis TaxID=483139 RepID=A0A2C6KM48_9APIC|nr:smc n terminal domain-containing protein [Cystoisospora suis]
MKRTRPVAAAAAESSWPASSHGSPNTKSDSLDSGVGSEHIRHSRLSPPGDISPLTSCSKADSDSDFAFSEEQRDKRLARYSARGAVCRPDEDQETSSSRSVRTPRSGAGQTRGTLPDVPFPDGGSGGERLSSDTRRVTSGSPHPGDTSTDESSVGYRPRARLQGGGRGVASAMATSSGRREGEKMRWAGPEDAEGSSNSRTSDTSSIREGDCSSVKSTTKRQPLLPGPRGASISRDPVTDAEGGRRGSRPSKQEEGAHPMDPAGLQLAISQESGNRRNGSNSAFNQGEDPANRNPRFLPPSQFGIEAVFQNGAKEGRLRLRWIVLENFKSYRGTHVVGPLTNSVGIVGPNGAGKSNLTDAVCFALGVNAKQLRCNRLVELINASETSSPLGTESSAGEDSNSFKERDKL